MPKFILVFFFVATLCQSGDSVGAQLTPRAGPQSSFATLSHAGSDDVDRTYQDLLSLDLRSRRRTFLGLSSSMKSALWQRQLLTALGEHPEFTNEQRAIIQEALDFLNGDRYERKASDVQWTAVVEQPLRSLMERAYVTFGSALTHDLFIQLGPAERALHTDAETPSPLPIKPLDIFPFPLPQCECSTNWDVCWFRYGTGWTCIQGGCWPTSGGCGPFYLFDCVGGCWPP